MPLYLFACTACEYQFDKYVRKMDTKTAECPECGQTAERGIERPSKFVWGKSGGWN